jgi:hypothetical protein
MWSLWFRHIKHIEKCQRLAALVSVPVGRQLPTQSGWLRQAGRQGIWVQYLPQWPYHTTAYEVVGCKARFCGLGQLVNFGQGIHFLPQ